MKTWLIGVWFLDHTKICSILWIDWLNLHHSICVMLAHALYWAIDWLGLLMQHQCCSFLWSMKGILLNFQASSFYRLIALIWSISYKWHIQLHKAVWYLCSEHFTVLQLPDVAQFSPMFRSPFTGLFFHHSSWVLWILFQESELELCSHFPPVPPATKDAPVPISLLYLPLLKTLLFPFPSCTSRY